MNAAFWRDRPVFVTGATGLVGTALTRHLVEAGATVVALVRDRNEQSWFFRSGLGTRVTQIDGCLEDQALLERALGEYEIRTVFHLAAQAIVGVAARNAVSTFESNVRGTWCLLEAVRRSPLVGETVVASSDKAYGDQSVLPYTEDMPLLAGNLYDVSKACTDMIAASFARTYGLRLAISRCGNFYGPGDMQWNRIVPGTMRSIIRQQPIVIRSDGSLVRDYFYVEDGASAYMALAEALTQHDAWRGEAFNFSTDLPLTVLQLVEQMQAVAGSRLPLDIRGEATHEILAQHLSSAKARRLLDWQPKYTLEQGLRDTYRWYVDALRS